jgi:hypothetical protein
MEKLLFSQRHGYTPIKMDIQLESMDDDLRRNLWDWVSISLGVDQKKRDMAIHTQLFKRPLDELNHYSHAPDSFSFRSTLRSYYDAAQWYQIYDLIELSLEHSSDFFREKYIEPFNQILENNLAGYRYIEGRITPITSPAQIATIEQAFDDVAPVNFAPVHQHLKKALDFYSNRHKPDYANSVRESVTALESLVKLITGTDTVDMNKVKQLLNLDDAKLASSIVSLWGYSNEKPGVRHARGDGDEKSPTASEALLVLSTSATLISYLIAIRGEKQVISNS